MLRNRQFHRSFIILKPQDSGYSLHDGKEPAGYVKLEIRNNYGKMHLYIQDMKPAMSQAIYDIVLISNRQEVEPVKLTSIQVPTSGRGEYEITFDPESVAETKNKIGDYHAFAVVERQLDNSGVLRYPLVGYSDKKVKMDWSKEVTNLLMRMYRLSRGNGLRELSQEREGDDISEEDTEADTIVEKHEADQENESIEEQQEQINPEILNFVPPDISYIYQDSTSSPKSLSQEPSSFEGGPIIHEDESPDLEGEPLTIDSEQTTLGAGYTASQDFYSMPLGNTPYWNRVEEYYNKLFESHKKVTPFDDAIGEVDWIRVENRNYPVYPYYGAYDPYYHYRQYGGGLDHYLVGLMRNQGKVQYVIYGIPGIYSAAPPMSMHGFSRWLPVKNGYGAGYWLLYIDGITGTIAYPY